MRIHFIVTCDELPGHSFRSFINLPRGCGMDFANDQIAKIAESQSRVSTEIYQAVTEGRKPNIEYIENL